MAPRPEEEGGEASEEVHGAAAVDDDGFATAPFPWGVEYPALLVKSGFRRGGSPFAPKSHAGKGGPRTWDDERPVNLGHHHGKDGSIPTRLIRYEPHSSTKRRNGRVIRPIVDSWDQRGSVVGSARRTPTCRLWCPAATLLSTASPIDRRALVLPPRR